MDASRGRTGRDDLVHTGYLKPRSVVAQGQLDRILELTGQAPRRGRQDLEIAVPERDRVGHGLTPEQEHVTDEAVQDPGFHSAEALDPLNVDPDRWPPLDATRHLCEQPRRLDAVQSCEFEEPLEGDRSLSPFVTRER